MTFPSLSSIHAQSFGGGQLGGRNDRESGLINGTLGPRPKWLKLTDMIRLPEHFLSNSANGCETRPPPIFRLPRRPTPYALRWSH